MQNIMRIIGTMGVHYLMKVTLLFLIIAFKIILLPSEIQPCLFVICLGCRKYPPPSSFTMRTISSFSGNCIHIKYLLWELSKARTKKQTNQRPCTNFLLENILLILKHCKRSRAEVQF